MGKLKTHKGTKKVLNVRKSAKLSKGDAKRFKNII